MTAKTNYKSIIFIGILISVLTFSSCNNNKWPQFRGPENNMIAKAENLPIEWGQNNNVKWTYDIEGSGWSSPIIWGNKVFISTSFEEKKAPIIKRDSLAPRLDPKDDKSFLNAVYRWELTCIDLKTGKELWKQVAHKGSPGTKSHSGNKYASETPVTDGKRIYVYYGMTGVFCYDLYGKLLWKKDMEAFYTLNGWGTGSSPVVYKNMLYMQVDNEIASFIVALDAKTGEEKWKVKRDEKTNYSTPIIWKNNVRTELITSGKKARSYDPVTGKILWELNIGGEMNIASPVADEDYLYLGNAGGRETKGTLFSVKAGAMGDITPTKGELVSNGVEWSNLDAGTGNPSPLLYNGLIYILATRGGEITCYNSSTGKMIYKEKVEKTAGCWGSPWAHNDKILFTDDKGVTHIIKAGEQFEVLSQNKIDDKFWASPAISNDAYIFKGVKSLYCISN